jgi:outer membrane receptor protein involved in Fe transport
MATCSPKSAALRTIAALRVIGIEKLTLASFRNLGAENANDQVRRTPWTRQVSIAVLPCSSEFSTIVTSPLSRGRVAFTAAAISNASGGSGGLHEKVRRQDMGRRKLVNDSLKLKTILTCSQIAIGLVWASGAYAQSAEPAAVQDAQIDAARDEIVVTANKREQSLSDVGLTIAALSGEQLQNQRISNVADLAIATPGLAFAPTPNNTPVYTLRGVGFYETSLAAYPDVSTYIDQFPLPLPIMSSLTAFDLERVEILKGPQGTLFGNNATGGAINFIAAKPTNEFAAGAELGYGRFNTFEGSGYISGSITDTLRGRFAVKAVRGDEWQKSYARNDKLGKTNNIAARLLLDWDPTENFKVSVNLNAWRERSDPQAPQAIALTPQNPAPPTWPSLNYPLSPQNARSADWNTGELRPFADHKFKQAALRADYSFGTLTLTSLTSYIDMEYNNRTEGGGTALYDLDLGKDQGDIESFSQELRISNDAASAFRWMIGANFEDTTVEQNSGVYYGDTTSGFANNINFNGYSSTSKMKNYAGFANAEYDVSDQITLKAGIRYTEAKRDFTVIVRDDPTLFVPPMINPATGQPFFNLTNFFNFAYGAIYGAGTVPTIPPQGGITLDTRVGPNGQPIDPSTYLTAGAYTNKLNENSTSWRVGVDYKPNDDLLLYINVAKGYKAGSFPHLVGTIYTAYNPVKQESLLDYEAGFKAQLMDGKLSIDGAAFFYDYKNKQLRAKFVDPIFGALDLLVNVPKSRIKGAELNVSARPVRGLSLSGSVTYLDATVRRYEGVVGSTVNTQGLREPIIESFAGVRLPFSPKWQYTLRFDYDTPITDNLNVFFGAGVSGQSKTSAVLTTLGQPEELFDLNARALVSGLLGVRAADDSWRVSVWGKNIFNKYYWVNAVQTYDTVVRYTGRPAEYGVTLGLKF